MGDEPVTVDTPLLYFQSTRGNRCILDGEIYALWVAINIFDSSELNCPVHVLICGPRDVKMRDQTLRAFCDRVVMQETGINDLVYNPNVLVNIWCDERVQYCVHFTCNATLRPKEISISSLAKRKTVTTTAHSNHIPGISIVSPFTMDQWRWALLGQFERSAFSFIKLGGHGPEGQHVPGRVDYLRMSPEVMKEQLRSFKHIYLFLLRNERLHNVGDHVDTFLSFLQREVNLDIGDCLKRFRSAFRRTRPINAECTGSTIFVKRAPGPAERSEFHCSLIFKQQGTETSDSLTKTGIKWYEYGDRDPTHDTTYPVKTDPGLQDLKDCALQFQPHGNTTEHWLCPCALWVSTVIREYIQKGYVTGISSSGISAEHLHLTLLYSR